MEFEGRSVVLTGGAKGIGEATARAFAREGARVAILDVDEQGARVAESIGGDGLFRKCDVSSGEQVKTAMNAVIEAFGRISVLINNAGIQTYGTVTETEEDEWDRTMGVNLKSAYLCAKYALPSMQEAGGVVVNVSSVQAFVSQKKVAAYTTSKTALLGLTRSIAVDYAPRVRCVAVCPGSVDTPMLQWAIRQSPDPEEVYRDCENMHPLLRVGRPEEVAELILYLASDKAGFITGQYVRIDGGLGITIGGSVRD